MVVIDVIFGDLFVIGMFIKNKVIFFYIKLFDLYILSLLRLIGGGGGVYVVY